jgi:hypothetical protein
MKQEFVYVYDKITHIGWVGSWQVRMAQGFINRGVIHYAIKNEESE